MDWKPVTKITDTACIDDTCSFRLPLCPIPLSFNRIPYHYNVYQYQSDLMVFSVPDLTSPLPPENDSIVLPPGYIQQGPNTSLHAGNYELHYHGKNLRDAICYPATNDGVMLDNTIIEQNDEEVIMTFTADYDLTGVEFITKNFEDYPITIELITINLLPDP